MTKARMELSKARELARKIAERLRPGCQRIAIAGSIRRGGGGGGRRERGLVGDIEIVAIPHMAEPEGVLPGVSGERASALDPILKGLVGDGKLAFLKGGSKYKQFAVQTVRPAMALDLFLATEANWGLIYAIRTGPADYSRRLVSPERRGGLLRDGCRVADGRLLREIGPGVEPTPDHAMLDGLYYEPIETAGEEDFFNHVRGGWVPPEERS